MSAPIETKTESRVRCEDLFSAVRPMGWLGERLKNVSNPRKRRWNAYVRACRRIPKSSPVYGTTSWDKINHRRHQLIDREMAAYAKTKKPWSEFTHSAELDALQDVAGEICCGPTVAQNFLMSRFVRRLKTDLAAFDATLKAENDRAMPPEERRQ